MTRFLEWLSIFIQTRNWGVLPAPLWFLVASPLLFWAGIGSRVFVWPLGSSRSPLRRSFWCVNWDRFE